MYGFAHLHSKFEENNIAVCAAKSFLIKINVGTKKAEFYAYSNSLMPTSENAPNSIQALSIFILTPFSRFC